LYNEVLVSFFCLPAQPQVSFFQPPTYAGSGNVFVADFNGDGKPDILTSDGTMNLGNGDGTFKTGTAVSGGVLAVADFNGDGKPDVLQQGTGTLLVLLGNGDGTFQAPISTNSGANLNPISAGNLTSNNQAHVVGVFNGSLYVYLSKGDGTFAAGVPYSLSLATGARGLFRHCR
jgi:FG-GAP-like repeat